MINRAALGRLSLKPTDHRLLVATGSDQGQRRRRPGDRDLAGTARRDRNRRGLPAGRGVAAARLVAVPGRFFTTTDSDEAVTAEASNREAIEEAAALNAVTLVLVPGGLPPGDRDLQGARDRAARAIERLVPYAHELGVNLGIEPMNPIYAADRGVISTLAQALDIAERFDATDVGVVVDTFHVWWEPGIDEQLQRAGERIVSYQICDWITPLPADTLARGMMGDGHIDFPAFTRSVARAGYRGDIEVEIFNADLWASPPAEVVDTMAERYLELVHPYLAE